MKEISPLWIPILALMIPIVAILGQGSLWLLGVVVTLIGATLAARSLMTHRHELRMKELEAERQIRSSEADQLRAAERILDLDDRVDEIRRDLEPPQEG